MRKLTIAILLVAALVVFGVSAGGSKALSGLQATIDKYKEPDIKVEQTESSDFVKYISVSDCSLGLGYDNSTTRSDVRFFVNEQLETKDFSTFIVRYDLSDNGLAPWAFPSLHFGVLASRSQKVDLDLSILCGEDPYTGSTIFSVKHGSLSKSLETVESLTFIYKHDGESSKVYIYANDEFFTVVEFDTVLDQLFGVYLEYESGTTLSSLVSFDCIELFGVATGYDGDLYDVLAENAPLTDSKDFNTIINGQ